MELTESLRQALQQENLSLTDWQELIQRLLGYGVLCRDESQVEADFYDRFMRLQDWVDEYLSLMGVRLHHDTHFQYVRVIPPGARVPGIDDETDTPFNGGLRARLNQHEIAVLLALRTEYDKSLREGQVNEHGCVTLSVEGLILTLKSLLNRQLPENQTERRQLFKRLRQLRVIQTGNDVDLVQAESWFKIRPMIVHMVNAELLDDLEQGIAAITDSDAENHAADVGAAIAIDHKSDTEVQTAAADSHSLFTPRD